MIKQKINKYFLSVLVPIAPFCYLFTTSGKISFWKKNNCL